MQLYLWLVLPWIYWRHRGKAMITNGQCLFFGVKCPLLGRLQMYGRINQHHLSTVHILEGPLLVYSNTYRRYTNGGRVWHWRTVPPSPHKAAYTLFASSKNHNSRVTCFTLMQMVQLAVTAHSRYSIVYSHV